MNLTSSSIIRQKNSWSRLQISREGFIRLLHSVGAPLSFGDFARAFGSKSSDSDENFGGYSQHIWCEKQENLQYELSYILRYPVKTAKDADYAWVLRQMAVYQNQCPNKSSSNWIFLQPSEHISSMLYKATNHNETSQELLIPDYNSTRLLNLTILSLTEFDWRQYVNHLESEIEKLNEKACFSRVGGKVKYDYSVTFSDSQELQQLRQLLLRALSAIESNMESCLGIQAHLRHYTKSSTKLSKQCTHMQLELFKSRMQQHKRGLTRLLEVSAGISDLLFKILDFRHDEVVRMAATNTQAILQATGTESGLMRIIAEETRGDSRSTKILTFVTLAYLPANLIAAIFSSNLVSTDNGGDTPVRQTQIGYYVLITLLLMIVTLLVTWALERNLGTRLLSRVRDIYRPGSRLDRLFRGLW